MTKKRNNPAAFKPGNPGGPGRPPGCLNKTTKEVREIAKDYGPAAVETLARIMEDDTKPAQARISAATVLLDRGYGKPSQQVDVDLGMGMAAKDIRLIPTEVLERIAARAMTDDEFAALPDLPGLPPGQQKEG